MGIEEVVWRLAVFILVYFTWDKAKFALLDAMNRRKAEKEIAFFAREAFKVRGRNEMSDVCRAVAFDSFMRWSGYTDYLINMSVFEEMREAGLL
ncbi:MAG: hypothetical protein LBK00_04555 [Treponema sp.]|jgi:hypothetical protein|nr:hypothetical protein [Treponema sp.]